jgi:hypothetical protein
VSLLRRLARLLRLEDVLLAVLAAIVLPAIDGWLAAAGGGTVGGGATGDPTVLAGSVGLVAIGGVIACVLTRGPDERPVLADGQLTLQGWARFPLAAGVGIVALETIPGLGFDPEPLVGLTFLATFAGALLHPRLPVVPVPYRRAMVLPMSALAAGAFDRVIGSGLGDLVGELVGGTAPPELAAFWPLLLAAAGAMYVMLVVAPRSVADPGASGYTWAVRFAFLIASIAAASVLGIR